MYPVIGKLELVGAVQLRLTSSGLPVPLSPRLTVGFVDELLVIVSCPVAEPVAVGLKASVTLSAWPGFRVVGKLTAEVENPVPLTEIELTVTAAVPLEVKVTVCDVELFTTTPPNEIFVALAVRVGVAAFNWIETLFEALPVLTLTVADWAVVTEAILAVNDALFAVAGIVMELGTVTALLLLARATLRPPVGAEPDKLTVHESERAPVIEVLLQERELTAGATDVPVPLRLTDALGALLEIVNCPAAELVLAGSN